MSFGRERAKLFEREAERYDRSRPGYPDALFDEILGASPRGMRVLDVGCGTGIAAGPMVARGAHVLGVELNPGMAAIAKQHSIPVEVSEFETWDPAGRLFDRVTCGQAWHWLDPVASTAKAASLLRPGGRLCLFWSVGHHPDDLADALHEIYERVLPPDAPRLMIGYVANRSDGIAADFSLVVDGLRASDRFAEPEQKRIPWSRNYTRDQWLDQLQSHSDHAALTPELRQRLLDEIGNAIDEFGGSFDMTYSTLLISATRS